MYVYQVWALIDETAKRTIRLATGRHNITENIWRWAIKPRKPFSRSPLANCSTGRGKTTNLLALAAVRHPTSKDRSSYAYYNSLTLLFDRPLVISSIYRNGVSLPCAFTGWLPFEEIYIKTFCTFLAPSLSPRIYTQLSIHLVSSPLATTHRLAGANFR